jgi:transcriptional regulator with GAF, ATPase, and Fis domain
MFLPCKSIRELQNVIERALIRSRGGRLQFDLGEAHPRRARKTSENPEAEEATPVLTMAEMRELERANIERALAQSDGQVYGTRGAAALLGMKPTTLWSRLRSLGISTRRRR